MLNNLTTQKNLEKMIFDCTFLFLNLIFQSFSCIILLSIVQFSQNLIFIVISVQKIIRK